MLTGERLRLRAVEPEDLALMYRVENDTVLWKHGSASVPYSRYVLRRYIEESTCDLYADRSLRMVMTTAEGVDVGFIDLQNFEPRHLRAEVGIVVLPEWQHCGFAREAVRLLICYASEHLHLHQLYVIVSVENGPAKQLFLQEKFKPSGILPEWLYKDEACYVDACILTRILL